MSRLAKVKVKVNRSKTGSPLGLQIERDGEVIATTGFGALPRGAKIAGGGSGAAGRMQAAIDARKPAEAATSPARNKLTLAEARARKGGSQEASAVRPTRPAKAASVVPPALQKRGVVTMPGKNSADIKAMIRAQVLNSRGAPVIPVAAAPSRADEDDNDNSDLPIIG